MKTAKILSCGILSILFIACGSDSSGTAAQTDELADGSITNPDGGIVAPDGGIIGSSGSVDFTSSANTDPFDTSFTGRSYALISSATFGISSSSTSLIGSSAGGSANPGIGGSNDSPDTEEDDVVSLDGSETTITFSGTDATVTNDNGSLTKGGKLLGFGTNNSEEGTQYSVNFTADNYYGTSEIAFKPSFSGSKMVSNVGQPGVVNSVSGMNKQCFGSSTTNCVYYR